MNYYPCKENKPRAMKLLERKGLWRRRRRYRRYPGKRRGLFRNPGPLPGRGHGTKAIRHPAPDGPYHRRGHLQDCVRLVGGVSVQCESRRAQAGAEPIFTVGAGERLRYGDGDIPGNLSGTASVLWDFLREIVVSQDGKEISALYNASLEDVELRTGDSPLDLKIYSKGWRGNGFWSSDRS